MLYNKSIAVRLVCIPEDTKQLYAGTSTNKALLHDSLMLSGGGGGEAEAEPTLRTERSAMATGTDR